MIRKADHVRVVNKKYYNLTTEEKIQLKYKEISFTDDSEKKKKLQHELQKLLLKKEIEQIQRKIEQLG